MGFHTEGEICIKIDRKAPQRLRIPLPDARAPDLPGESEDL